MTKEQAVRQFRELYADFYVHRVDYWFAQLAWSEYTDTLCRNGEITLKQFESWPTPFKYGKHLRPTRKQIQMCAC